MVSTCLWQLENDMSQHHDPVPSTEVDESTPNRQKRSHDVPPSTEAEEPTPKTTAPGNVSHKVSSAN